MNTEANKDIDEIEAFEAVAEDWWNPQGPFKPLHDINPSRLAYVERHAALKAQRAVDVGCGGGLLCEAMARRGAEVTGLDMGDKALQVAAEHARVAALDIRYLNTPAEQLALDSPQGEAHSFAVVTCMEVLEHVPDPSALVAACAKLASAGGHVFFSTLNRTPLAWLLAIVGGEYITRIIPKGTHHYRQFIKPSELARMALACGLEVLDVSGMHYNPVARRCTVDNRADVNYLMCCRAPKENKTESEE